MSALLTTSIDTPLGTFSLTTSEGRVIEATFGPAKNLKSQGRRVRSIPGVTGALRRYFDGDLDALESIPVTLQLTEFQLRVLRSMRKIKTGTTMSYQQLAIKSGSPRASRAVGSACAKNPIPLIIPCHRVITSDGSLGNYGYGKKRKRWLLEFEGATSRS